MRGIRHFLRSGEGGATRSRAGKLIGHMLATNKLRTIEQQHEGLPGFVFMLKPERVLDIADTVEFVVAVDAGPAENMHSRELIKGAELEVDFLVPDCLENLLLVLGVRELNAW